MVRFVLAALIILAPAIASAAGFAKESLFLSKSPVTEGETVLIYAVLANDTTEQFKGEVRLRSGDTAVGTVSAVLAAGEARTVSVSWSPKAGTHAVTAELKTSAGEILASEQATFVIEEKPSPPTKTLQEEKAAAAVESSAPVKQAIANVSPQAARAAQPVFATLDSWREKGAEFLDKQIADTKGRLPKGGVLGAETAKNASSDPMGSALNVFQTLYLYLLTILRYIIASAVLFYPLLAIIFIWSLWKLYRRMSRPRWA